MTRTPTNMAVQYTGHIKQTESRDNFSFTVPLKASKNTVLKILKTLCCKSLLCNKNVILRNKSIKNARLCKFFFIKTQVNLKCTDYSVHITVYKLECTDKNVQITVYRLQCTDYSV